MKLLRWSVALSLAGMVGVVSAEGESDPTLARNLAATCANCHGTDGRAQAGPGMDALAEAEVEYQDKNSPAIDVGFKVLDNTALGKAFGVDVGDKAAYAVGEPVVASWSNAIGSASSTDCRRWPAIASMTFPMIRLSVMRLSSCGRERRRPRKLYAGTKPCGTPC